MGGIIGGVMGMMGAQAQADAAKESAAIQAAAMDRAGERALTGYKYLTEGAGAPYSQAYMNTGVNALASQSGVQNSMLGLLGLGQYANVGSQTPTGPAFQGQQNALATGSGQGGSWSRAFENLPPGVQSSGVGSYSRTGSGFDRDSFLQFMDWAGQRTAQDMAYYGNPGGGIAKS